MKPLSKLLLVIFMIFELGAAEAVPVSNGVQVDFVVRDCRSEAVAASGSQVPDLCLGTSGIPFVIGRVVEQGGSTFLGALRGEIAPTSPLASSGGKSSRVYGDAGHELLGVSQLKVGVFTLPYARASVFVDAFQSYLYDGSGPTSRVLRHSVDVSADNLLSYDDFLNSPVAATSIDSIVVVFSLDSPTFDFVGGNFWDDAQSSGADFRWEASYQTDYTDGVFDTDLPLTLEAGRYYFVETYLFVVSKLGASLDGLHTFTASLGVIDNDGIFSRSLEGLTPAQAVPEPSLLALCILGLVALSSSGLTRRRDS